MGTKVSYTAAAHSIETSRQEHARVGLPFNYPHLTDPQQWERYVGGYKAADVVVCPSTYSKRIMEGYGCKNVVVIPHGCEIPKADIAPLPTTFTVGYLGSFGADKSVWCLLAAWKLLNYKDATLVLAGADSTSPWVDSLIARFGGGNIHRMGWVNDVADFYNGITLYCQCSSSEGFGIEVLEALAYGRPVICSIGAGAADVVPLGPNLEQFKVSAADPKDLADAIDCMKKKTMSNLVAYGTGNRQEAAKYTWPAIRERYKQLWRSMLQ